jgi:hypothetical protein
VTLSRFRLRRAAALGVFASLLVAAAAGAVDLAPGDIVVADQAGNRVIRLDPQGGVQTTISSGGSFLEIQNATVGASGDELFVTQNVPPSVIRVSAQSGAQTTVTSAVN